MVKESTIRKYTDRAFIITQIRKAIYKLKLVEKEIKNDVIDLDMAYSYMFEATGHIKNIFKSFRFLRLIAQKNI